jgi:hypothetical protein
VAILLAGLIVGAFGQGLIGNARLNAFATRHDEQIQKLVDADNSNYSALQASFRRRDEKTSMKMDKLAESISEVLRWQARWEGRRGEAR